MVGIIIYIVFSYVLAWMYAVAKSDEYGCSNEYLFGIIALAPITMLLLGIKAIIRILKDK